MPGTRAISGYELRHGLDAYRRDWGDREGRRRFRGHLTEALQARELSPEDFSIRDLFEALVDGGADVVRNWQSGRGSYGADIKTGGFSGMLCETLIVSRGEFPQVVQDFTDWREDEFIDVENYYEGRREIAHRIFREPFVVIDPVDKGRNLAAAVQIGRASCRERV